MEKWNKFTQEFSKEILPLYENHEKTFDFYGIHSQLHISRSIIFSEFLSRHFKNIGYSVDFTAVRYAVSFHDSGRQSNGIDKWVPKSSDICFSYIKNKYNLDYSKYVSSLILKNKSTTDINKRIVYDVDVLEIMRPICGHGGKLNFKFDELLSFNDDKKLRDIIVEDAWKLIKYTEDNKYLFSGTNHLNKLLNIIESDSLGLSLLKI